MEAVLLGFGVVFLAEMGDKTQLVAASLATRYRASSVFVGLVLAQALSQGMAVGVGGLLGAALPTAPLGVAAGLLFLAFAVWTLRSPDETVGDQPRVGGRSVVASVATAMFVAELGDKTMVAAAALATQAHPLLTWVGSTVGIVAAGGIAVVAGNALGARVAPRTTRLVAAAGFALFGVGILVVSLVELLG